MPISCCKAPCLPPCDGQVVADGLCNAHRMRRLKGLSISVPIKRRTETPRPTLGSITVSVECQAEIDREAERTGKSAYEVHQSVVENWAKTARNSKT